MCYKKAIILEGVLVSVLLLRRDTMAEATLIKERTELGLALPEVWSIIPTAGSMVAREQLSRHTALQRQLSFTTGSKSIRKRKRHRAWLGCLKLQTPLPILLPIRPHLCQQGRTS